MGFYSQKYRVNRISSGRQVPESGTGDDAPPAAQPLRAVLCDMDNTLFDLVGAQMAACRAVEQYLGVPEEDTLYPYFLRPVHGYESHENILDFIRDRGIESPDSYAAARRLYEVEKLRAIIPYPGVADTLGQIRNLNIPLGIITDAHSRDAVRRLEKAGLMQYFCCMMSYDMVRVKKPAHQPFLAALGMLKSPADGVLLVGDSPRRDIEPGKALGFRTAYARYGDRFSDDRSPVQADYILDSFAGLTGILAGLPVTGPDECGEDSGHPPGMPV